jgi:hypothetical protein
MALTYKAYFSLGRVTARVSGNTDSHQNFVLSRSNVDFIPPPVTIVVPVHFGLSRVLAGSDSATALFNLSRVQISWEEAEAPGGNTYEKEVQDDVTFDDTVSAWPYAKSVQDDVEFSDDVTVIGEWSHTVTDDVEFSDTVLTYQEFEDSLQDDVTFDDDVEDEYIPGGEQVSDGVEFGDSAVTYTLDTVTDGVEFTDEATNTLTMSPIIYESVYFRKSWAIDSNHKYPIDGVVFRDFCDGNVPSTYEMELTEDVVFDNSVPEIVDNLYEMYLEEKAVFKDYFQPLSYTISWRCRTRRPGIGYGGTEYGYQQGYGEGDASDIEKFRVKVYSFLTWDSEATLARDFEITISDTTQPDDDATFTYTEAMQRTDHSGELPVLCYFEVYQIDTNGNESPY